MRLEQAEQIPESKLFEFHFDVIIAASGYERRAPVVAQRTKLDEKQHKLAFAFPDRITLSRRRNDRTFAELGFRLITAPGSSGAIVKAETLHAIKSVAKSEIAVLIDYSSMTKIWYAAILRLLSSDIDLPASTVRVYFAYTPSRFSRPSQPAPNQYMGPIPGFYNLDLPDRKSALVIGLGYEAERAAGLVEYVEPAETFAFYTDPALDSSFPRTVRRNNEQLLRRLGSGRVFKYPSDDLRTTATILLSLCSGLAKDFRVILAPLGPKPFALLCFLLAARYEDFDVWRVSPGEQAPPSDRPAGGETIVACVEYKTPTVKR